MRAPVVFASLAAWALPVLADGPPATDPAKPLDARVVTALGQAGLTYSDDDGDFRLVLNLADSRSQVVWVASSAARVTNLEFRDVWALAYRGEGQVPPEMARRLLTENARMVVGAWQVNQAPDRYLVVYLAQLPAATDAASLREVIEAVAISADRMEQELTGRDEF